MLSAYDTPQIRAFFSHELRNAAGKVRFDKIWEGVQVPEGIKQVSVLTSVSS
jgi:U3 small nucleolar RNA-associated protein 25